jgi:hypothetical protein
MKTLIVVLAAFALPLQAHAWGGRGHAAICETAVFLLKEPGLKEYLQNKPQMMSHLCNLPDTYWRSLGPEVAKLGNPTHFIDVDLIGLKAAEVPTDFATIVHAYTGAPNQFKREGVIRDVPAEFGSLWWRADQFYRRSLSFGRQLQAAARPKNAAEARDDRLPYNMAVYEMVVSLGLMGHFVGDASQPLHNTADYDGYATGHGGLHAYYEDDVVGQFDGDVHSRVLKEARAMKEPRCLKPPTVIEKMKALSEASLDELKPILEMDPLKKPSMTRNETGIELKIPADCAGMAVGHQRYKGIIVTELSRSALLLAKLWDDAYVEAGRPRLIASKSYRYPLTVEFVAPDYLPAETKTEKRK